MTSCFFRDLERFDSQVALVDEQGRATSYGDLRARADRLAEQLGSTRRLVFLEFERTQSAIAAYLGALRGGHVVLPFAREDEDKLRRLRPHFSANVVLRPRNGSCEMEWLDRREIELHPELCLLLSTSGSTGSPKLVKLSRTNLSSNATAIAQYLELTSEERGITTLPFHYSYGLSVLHSHLACGASLALSDGSVSEARFWSLVERLGATSFAGVPHTFHLLERADPSWARTPRLRYATQAGGRLAPEAVRRYARLGSENGWRFFVMYGQTEAAPRIAYLPPERAESSAHCIGVAVPGGEIVLLGEDGRPVTEAERQGELCYRGPNVMLGYAHSSADLVSDETPALLRTGDLACRDADGLFRIVGRLARFVKPFGLRVNLDEVEARVRESWPDSACAGNDERIVVALAGSPDSGRARSWVSELARFSGLPETLFVVTTPAELPALQNGKLDYPRILEGANAPPAGAPPLPVRPRRSALLRQVLSRRMLELSIEEAARILGVAQSSRESVAAIYHAVLRVPEVGDQDTFVGLNGDSLSYVDVSLALEEYLGQLPRGWEQMTVAQLEGLRGHEGAL